ncbi:hypothetical protein NKJ09_23225 [Mesorhizobium sp. M0189]|uniref:hypothetical protein n=1 Tax=Mesorhizobium sp. M0189 TaxID=2956909 RepID=UPI00333D3067
MNSAPAPLLADLTRQLADAQQGHANSSFIDNYADMKREQADWQIEIDRIKAAIAGAEKL